MVEAQFLLDGRLVDPPRNWKDLMLEYDWVNGRPTGTLGDVEFVWVLENAQRLNDWVSGGLGSGYGILEGPRLEVKLKCPGEEPLTMLKGFVSLADEESRFSCEEVAAPAVSTESVDEFKDRAYGFSFAYLFSQGAITKEDYVRVDYLINRVPDYEHAAILSISLFLMVKEVYQAVKDVGDIISDAAGVFNIGGAIGKVVVLIAYWVLLVVIIVNLLKELIDSLFPMPKSWYGMRLETLLERGAAYLGYGLQTNLFTEVPLLKDAALVPAKFREGVPAGKNSDDAGYPEQTFGQFLDDFLLLTNSRVEVRGEKLVISRKTDDGQYSGFTLRDHPKPTGRTNASEWQANYYLKFRLDESDPNTVADSAGRLHQVTVSPVRVGERKNVELKGLLEVEFPYARASRKESETRGEKIFKGIFNAYNSTVGKIRDGLQQLKRTQRNRRRRNQVDIPDDVEGGRVENIKSLIGYMKVNAEYFSVNKLILADPTTRGKLHPDNNKLTAKFFWEHFYRFESPVPTPGRPAGNQYRRYEVSDVKLCCHDLLKIAKAQTIFVTSLGKQARMEKLVYNPHRGTATLRFRVNEQITANLQQTEQ